MKIALNIESFSIAKGGGEVYANSLATQFLGGGHEVHVFSTSFDGGDGEIEGLHLHKVPVISVPRSLRALTFARNSSRLLRDGEFDAVIGFGGSWEVDVLISGGGTETVFSSQNLLSLDSPVERGLYRLFRKLTPRDHIRFFIDRRLYGGGRLKLVLPNSNMVKAHIVKYHDFPVGSIRVVYNGVDLEKFNTKDRGERGKEIRGRYGIGDEEVVILFMANNFRLKGLSCLIRAAGQLKGKVDIPFRLIVAGKGKSRGSYERLAAAEGCGERIIFVGRAAEPERFFAAADIFVHPTFYDPCAGVCMEAMASGLPVVTTRFNGAGELVTDGVDGFVVDDPRDADTLAEKIAWFFDEAKRTEAGKKAREAMEEYPWERNYTEIMEALGGLNA
ncbi:MAG: glycosyltransferase family 4 protein [Thermodesulfobacteriota bacterium]